MVVHVSSGLLYRKYSWCEPITDIFFKMGVFFIITPIVMLCVFPENVGAPVKGVVSGVFLGLILLSLWILKRFAK